VTVGTLLAADPLFVAPDAFDFGLGAGSGAIDQATGVPAGFVPDLGYAQVPVALQPVIQRNGLAARVAHGAALDLGALEGP
jgi:hypothetical protein